MKIFIYLLVAAVVPASAFAENKFAYQLPPATTVEITSPITIPPDHSRVLYQYGKPVSFQNMSLYQHHCWLETDRRDSRPQTVEPDTARIMKVRYGSEDVDQLTDNIITRLELRSSRQPLLRAIECEIWINSATDFGQFISVQELLETFGGVVKIRSFKAP